jgi:hypothetical protein
VPPMSAVGVSRFKFRSLGSRHDSWASSCIDGRSPCRCRQTRGSDIDLGNLLSMGTSSYHSIITIYNALCSIQLLSSRTRQTSIYHDHAYAISRLSSRHTILTYCFALRSILTRISMTLANRPQLTVVVSITANLATLPSREARLPTQ